VVGHAVRDDLFCRAALVFTLIFAHFTRCCHSALQRRDGDAAPPKWSLLFPPVALAALLLPIFQAGGADRADLAVILLLDLLAVLLAALAASAVPVLVVLGLTLVPPRACSQDSGRTHRIANVAVVVAACAVSSSRPARGLWRRTAGKEDGDRSVAGS